jgi:hypothetical protein
MDANPLLPLESKSAPRPAIDLGSKVIFALLGICKKRRSDIVVVV